ncbi:MAG: hypothetical protein JXB39_00400 [Deltaproteobacteria bacterium]|nr:hypothetical protein [Deltaproteobacteria bacterium]
MDLPTFTSRVRAAGSAQAILALLRTGVLPHYTGSALTPFLRVVMGAARHFNEDLDDAASAVELWSEVHARSPDPDGPHAVLAIMMSVANKRSNASLPRGARNVPASALIYGAVHRLHVSPDQDLRVVRTMMDAANRLTDLSRPWAEMDVPGAVTLWTALYRLDVSDDDRVRVVRTMMDVANRLTDLRDPGRRTDVPAAVHIWTSLGELPVSYEDRLRVVLTMMALANRMSRVEAPPDERDIAGAVLAWQAAWRLGRRVDADCALQVVRTMMDVANRFTDLEGDRTRIDVEAAAAIWTGVVEAAVESEDRDRAVRTMMAVAGRLLGPEASEADVLGALRLYRASWRCDATGEQRLRVVKTVLDVLSRFPHAAGLAVTLLGARPDLFPDERFRDAVRTALLYYLDDYGAVVAHVDGHRAPDDDLRALRADALRKLRRYEVAIDACTRLLDRAPPAGPADVERLDARISALCCRGYCHLEKGRTDPAWLPQALADLEAALAEAKRAALPPPPRAWTGLGYVLRLLDRPADAEAAFARAMELDHDNRKALEARA